MKCDELRNKVDSGAPLDSDAWDHATSCTHCREEFAHLRALRATAPEPPAGLRDRVVEAAFPGTVKRGFRWTFVASAAAVALAFAGGIALGRGSVTTVDVDPIIVERVVEKEVVREVEKKKTADDGDMFMLALALEKVYATQVCIDYEGVSCAKIHADKAILDYIQYCPVARKLWVAANERPDVVEINR